VFFNRFSTNRRLTQLESDLTALTRAFQSVQQEWDATSLRVTKTLRRLRSAEVRREQEESDTGVETQSVDARLAAAGTLGQTPDRMTRIREQLAARGRKDGE
jgi:hypothetical protein